MNDRDRLTRAREAITGVVEAHEGNALLALLEIARLHSIALIYLNRIAFEDFVDVQRPGQPLTAEEWGRIERLLYSYDAFVEGFKGRDEVCAPVAFMRWRLDHNNAPGPDGQKWSKA